jgi:hypothetical protein
MRSRRTQHGRWPAPECWDLLIQRSGYSMEKYQAWVEDTLAAALLHPSLLADVLE